MRTSTAGMLAIADHEAVVLSPYDDSVGVKTIGIGHTASAGTPDPRAVGEISLDYALNVFQRDLAKFEARVNKWVKVPLAQHEFDAIVSFDFNTGGVRYYDAKRKQWRCASLVTSLNAGDREMAGRQFMNWVKPPEITGRRRKEQDLFRTGRYPNVTTLKVYDRFPGRMRKVPVPERFLSGAPVPRPSGGLSKRPKTFCAWLRSLFRR